MNFFIAAALLLSSPFAALAQTGSSDAEDLRERLKALEGRLQKLESAPVHGGISPSALNPSIGMSLDSVLRVNDYSKSGFFFRSAELHVGAAVDPHLKAWAIINGNSAAVEVEEAAVKTTALPHALTLTAGRLFASFGRLPHFHDHELPTVDRPQSIDVYVGGESKADGVEASWLFPTPFFLTGVLGVYNKLGADNTRTTDAALRPLDELTYLGRVATSADLGADHSVEVGLSSAWTPKRTVQEDTTFTASPARAVVTRKNTWRTLHGVDLTVRWQPTSGGVYRGAAWGTEVLQHNERRFAPLSRLPVDRVRGWAGYSFIEVKAGRRWRPGFLVDLTQDLDDAKILNRTFASYLTFDISGHNRLRLQYSRMTNNDPRRQGNNLLSLQWSTIIGHHAHGFRDR